MKKVLILCTGNSCRSQMGDGWLKHLAGDRIEVYSAGTHPEPVNPYAVKVMKSSGIDISNYNSNLIDDYIDEAFDFVITVCDNAKERCPHFPNSSIKIHHSFIDPASAKGTDAEITLVYETVRDQIRDFLIKFIDQNISY